MQRELDCLLKKQLVFLALLAQIDWLCRCLNCASQSGLQYQDVQCQHWLHA